MAHATEYLKLSGLKELSSLGREIIHTYFTLWLTLCVDGLDATQLSSAEHQCQRYRYSVQWGNQRQIWISKGIQGEVTLPGPEEFRLI